MTELTPLSPEALAAAAASWRACGAARLPGALAPGTVAELAVDLVRLPQSLSWRDGEIVWMSEINVPVPPPGEVMGLSPLFRIATMFEREVPRLFRAIADRAVVPATPRTFRLIAYRKGSWTEAASGGPPGALACSLAITGSVWPREWGGYDGRRDRDGGLAWCEPSVPGTLELADDASVRSVEPILRAVERLELLTWFAPAEAAS